MGNRIFIVVETTSEGYRTNDPQPAPSNPVFFGWVKAYRLRRSNHVAPFWRRSQPMSGNHLCRYRLYGGPRCGAIS